MTPLVPDNFLAPVVPSGADPRANLQRNTDRPFAPSQDTPPKENLTSVRVVLSDKALEQAAKTSKAMNQFIADATQTRHDQTRLRLVQIKDRINTLKKMLMFLGQAAAKSILRELRQLAGELGQAASALKDSAGAQPARVSFDAAAAPVAHGASGAADNSATLPATAEPAAADTGDSPDQTAAPISEASSRALTAYAAVGETAVAADADASAATEANISADDRATAAPPNAAVQDSSTADSANGPDNTTASATASPQIQRITQKQRQDDAQAIRDVLNAMKELLAMLKSKLQRHDKESQKYAAEVEDTLAQVEKTAQALEKADSSPSAST